MCFDMYLVGSFCDLLPGHVAFRLLILVLSDTCRSQKENLVPYSASRKAQFCIFLGEYPLNWIGLTQEMMMMAQRVAPKLLKGIDTFAARRDLQ